MRRSVEQVANTGVSEDEASTPPPSPPGTPSTGRQSTSRTGAAWQAYVCRALPESASQTMAVLSTEPDNRRLPRTCHFREKTGPPCPASVWRGALASSAPLPPTGVSHTRARPSYEPVARRPPSGRQSKVVTSRALSPGTPPPGAGAWRRMMAGQKPPPDACAAATSQMRAVASPEPVARRGVPAAAPGAQAQTKTSEAWPSSVVTWSSGTAAAAAAAAAAPPPPPLAPPLPPGPDPPARPRSRRSATARFSSSTSFVRRSCAVSPAKSPETAPS